MPADPATTVRPGVYGLPGIPDPSLSYRGVVRSLPALLGYWRLQETSGTSAADDLGVRAGTYNNSPTLGAVGPFGGSHKAVTFNGTNHTVSIASALTDSTDRSVALWVKSSTAQTSKVAFDETTSSSKVALRVGTGPNPVAGGVASNLSGGMTGNNNSTLAGSTSSALSDGIWHHVVVVQRGTVGANYSSANTKLYYDGALVSTAARSDENYVGTNCFAPTAAVAARIGSIASGASQFWTGSISEVAVWGAALTAAQVATLFRARR